MVNDACVELRSQAADAGLNISDVDGDRWSCCASLSDGVHNNIRVHFSWDLGFYRGAEAANTTSFESLLSLWVATVDPNMSMKLLQAAAATVAEDQQPQ